eukprot:gnl/MRDRNA2_/MRDRNA2_35330_c0_seq1.p1 gnl/MRDRNA2_/MRDRNA2_35330_c0~~gnl/MRDRNA2_/MRDRNA2_35330_c0_seq1.p1  ORF type:complete len:1020 (+),score=186.88 gnl/MRDRNA2_/MRDRNA2_35330_c0_seq1:75-3134(+)
MGDSQQLPPEHSAQFHFSRYAPIPAQLPNLFHATFEQGRKLSAGESYMQKTIREFDAGRKTKRKAILEGFLEYVGRESRCGVEDTFRHHAHLFFMRLTSWFSVTLPMFYELPLQLKVFQAFLEFHEQVFVEAFFESGVVVPLMHTLSVSFDVPDEVRCLSLVVLQKLAANGRHCKELLCANHLVDRVVECVSDGLKWETLKQAGRLLCELFRGNPLHQAEVLDALESLLAHRLPITQRIGCQSLITLLSEGSHNPLLREKERHNALTTQALALLESHDIRVGADAYCLLCRLVTCFGCDSLLFSFARAQLRTEKECTDEWLRLELEAQKHHEHGGSSDHVATDSAAMPFGGRLHGTTNCLRRRIVENLQTGTGTEDDTFEGAQKNNAEFRQAFSAEAGHLLKWGVLLFLVKRNQGLCAELVEHGLTETLLMCLLDVSQPVRQAAALTELHRLRLLSKRAEVIVESVLVKKELLSAMSLHDFMSKATESDLQRARYLLRNMQASDRRNAYSAKEFALQQSLLEKDMTGILEDQDAAPTATTNFLTEVPEEAKEDQKVDDDAAEGVAPAPSKERSLAATGGVEEVAEAVVEDKVQQKEDEIPRFGKDTIPVQRVPESKSGMGLNKEDYKLEVPLVEEIPFCGSLSSLLFDPLELTADEESPLVQEVRGVAAVGSLRKAVDTTVQPLSSRRTGPRKPSHRPGPGLQRALALNMRNLDLRPQIDQDKSAMKGAGYPRRPMSVTESVCSSRTDLSVKCGHPDEASMMHGHDPYGSMQETTVGPNTSVNEFSRELPSTEYHSMSRDLQLAGGPSIFSDGPSYDALDREMAQHGQSQLSLHSHDHGDGCCHHPQQTVGDRSTVVTAIDHSGVNAPGKKRINRKQVLHVAPPVEHDCLVFDKGEQERQRQRCADSISKLLHPKTQQKFADLKDAGGFPRRFTRRQIPADSRFAMKGVVEPQAATQPAQRVPSRGIGFSAGQPVGETPESPNVDQSILPPVHARLAQGGGDKDILRSVFPASHAMTAR